MSNERYEYLRAYKGMLNEEDAVTPPDSPAANAPEGSMSSAGYMQQFRDNPKLAAYNTGGARVPGKKKRKKKDVKLFDSEKERELFIKDNPSWVKAEELEESVSSDRRARVFVDGEIFMVTLQLSLMGETDVTDFTKSLGDMAKELKNVSGKILKDAGLKPKKVEPVKVIHRMGRGYGAPEDFGLRFQATFKDELTLDEIDAISKAEKRNKRGLTI